MKRLLTLTAAALIAATSAQAIETTPGPDSNKQFFPIASYRVGPYAASGASIWAGRIDYYRYINKPPRMESILIPEITRDLKRIRRVMLDSDQESQELLEKAP